MFSTAVPINKVERRREPLTRTLPAIVVLAAVVALWRYSGQGGTAADGLLGDLQQVSQEHQQMAERMQLWGQLIPFMQM